MNTDEITKRYNDAVDSFVDKLRGDPNIIAVFLAGSLAYDKVWEKSDVDLTVIVRDQALTARSYCIDEDNIILNVGIMTRTDFVKMLGKVKGGGFSHSIMSKGKFIYLTDDSLNEHLEDFKQMGDDDRALSFFVAACYLLGVTEKVEKWLIVKDDPMYAQYYILKAADLLANLELIRKSEIPSRESVLRLAETDPDFIAPYYNIPLSKTLTRAEVAETLSGYKQYLIDNLELLSRPAIEYLADGEVKTVTELCKHYEMDSHGITHVFEFLAEQGIIEKVSQTIRLTSKGKKSVEEVAFMYISEGAI